MKSLECLNCNQITEGNFCSNCGQKTDTHRITAKHFLMHDLLHGVWHIEKGILFTIKQALLRPGTAALEYISGKRIKYYNVFYLILLMIGFTILAKSTYDKMAVKYFGTIILPREEHSGKTLDQFISDYDKLLIFAFVPLFALNSFILFRRKKLNFSEHSIIAGMMFLGVITITLIGEILYLTEFIKNLDILSRFVDFGIPIIVFIYVIINYFQTFKQEQSIFSMLFKMISFLTLLLIEILIITILITGYVSNWTFNIS
ncbi:DUF3667 domain-containing protein [Flavobacterium antarcticum]|uniref:DUF3667 domain-containing protein n=1 Tax=Flavobacterium antarcticum TaxID=271155 RepID=UPI0003B7122D|nr:DUF3667 domain-containing protein [Flavobacterium antarcticum]